MWLDSSAKAHNMNGHRSLRSQSDEDQLFKQKVNSDSQGHRLKQLHSISGRGSYESLHLRTFFPSIIEE